MNNIQLNQADTIKQLAYTINNNNYYVEKIPFQNAIILKSTNSLYKDIIVEDFDKFKVVAVVRGKFRVI